MKAFRRRRNEGVLYHPTMLFRHAGQRTHTAPLAMGRFRRLRCNARCTARFDTGPAMPSTGRGSRRASRVLNVVRGEKARQTYRSARRTATCGSRCPPERHRNAAHHALRWLPRPLPASRARLPGMALSRGERHAEATADDETCEMGEHVGAARRAGEGEHAHARDRGRPAIGPAAAVVSAARHEYAAACRALQTPRSMRRPTHGRPAGTRHRLARARRRPPSATPGPEQRDRPGNAAPKPRLAAGVQRRNANERAACATIHHREQPPGQRPRRQPVGRERTVAGKIGHAQQHCGV